MGQAPAFHRLLCITLPSSRSVGFYFLLGQFLDHRLGIVVGLDNANEAPRWNMSYWRSRLFYFWLRLLVQQKKRRCPRKLTKWLKTAQSQCGLTYLRRAFATPTKQSMFDW